MTLRILLTGSRSWTDKRVISRAFIDAIDNYGTHLIADDAHGPRLAWHEIVAVHGGARGADTIAARIASMWGMSLEPHPVTDDDWHASCRPECKPGHRRIGRDGRGYCPAAGNYRNQKLVNLGADVCLAFPLGRSSGTRNCLRLAQEAGIPTVVYEGLGVLTRPVVAS